MYNIQILLFFFLNALCWYVFFTEFDNISIFTEIGCKDQQASLSKIILKVFIVTLYLEWFRFKIGIVYFFPDFS